jgi:hypothetical protein
MARDAYLSGSNPIQSKPHKTPKTEEMLSQSTKNQNPSLLYSSIKH